MSRYTTIRSLHRDQMIRIGQRIRDLRTERKIPQDRLALRANLDQSGLSKLERGVRDTISRPSLERIAEVLGIPFEDLVQGTDHEDLIA